MAEFRMRCYMLGTLTDELSKELKKVGYKIVDLGGTICKYGNITASNGNIFVNIPEASIQFGIDCGENVDLFLALAYLRFDSDINQWFTDGEHWHIYTGKEIVPDNYHKASVIELIKHFA